MSDGRRRKGGRGELAMVPDAEFTSYYGRPIINKPVWRAPDIAGYFYLGGLAGVSSMLAFGADRTARPGLAQVCKVGAAGSISLGMLGLVHDLGRPTRFVNMLRVFKPTSPLNVGSWLLAGYGPAAVVAAGSAVTGLLPRLGTTATASAAAMGPLVASYTATLVSDTAVPAWHEAYREMPFVFVSSAASAAGGLGMLAAPASELGPARAVAVAGAAGEILSAKLLVRRLGEVAQPYQSGVSGRLMRAAEAMTAAAVAVAAVSPKRSWLTRLAGAGLLTASALTRFGIFEAGMVSAQTPEHTIGPQRQRLQPDL